MKTIYMVSKGSYSEYAILSVFEDKADAEAYVQTYNVNRTYNEAEIEERPMHERGEPIKFKWRGHARLDGDNPPQFYKAMAGAVEGTYELQPVEVRDGLDYAVYGISAEGWTADEVRQRLEAKIAELKAASHA